MYNPLTKKGFHEQQEDFPANKAGTCFFYLLPLNIDRYHLFDKESFILQSDPVISTLKLLIQSEPGLPETYSVLTLTSSTF
jgi:hypothetical protein